MQKRFPIPVSTILLFLGVLGFVWAKWTDLSLPFFWDELGVYSPGILYLLDHGVGMLPSHLPPELSRGHPLFFYFFFAALSKLFGYSIVKLHVMAMGLTISWVVSTWWMGRKLLGNWAGLVAGMVFLFMPNVFAQGHLVLPEVMMALWVLWGLYHFHQGNGKLYFLFAVLGVLTKETALVLPMACLTYSLLFLPGERLRKSLLSLSPILVFVLFLVIQRFQNGWFFFPFHTQFISLDLAELNYKLSLLSDLLFVYQGRWAMSIVLGIGFVLWMVRKRSFRLRHIPSWFQLSGIYLLGLIVFTLINVYMDRYLLSLLPLLALGVGAVLKEVHFLKRPFCQLGWGLAILPFVFLFYHRGTEFRYDMDINYRDIVEVQQAATTYLERNIPAGDTIFASFPLYNSLTDPRFGFLADSVDFTLTVRPKDKVSYVGFVQPGVKWTGAPLDPAQKVWTFTKGYATAEVYRLD